MSSLIKERKGGIINNKTKQRFSNVNLNLWEFGLYPSWVNCMKIVSYDMLKSFRMQMIKCEFSRNWKVSFRILIEISSGRNFPDIEVLIEHRLRCMFICIWRKILGIAGYACFIFGIRAGIALYESFLKEFRTGRCACRQGRSDSNLTVKQSEYSWMNEESCRYCVCLILNWVSLTKNRLRIDGCSNEVSQQRRSRDSNERSC